MRSKFKCWTVLKYTALTVLGVVLYKFCAGIAYQQRGYFAVGGEIFMLLLPVIYYLMAEMIHDVVDDCRSIRKDDWE